MKKNYLGTLAVLSLVGLSAVSCSKSKEPKTEEEKTFYSIGTMFGSRLTQLSMSDAEIDALASGLRDAAKMINKKLIQWLINKKSKRCLS